jgi:hypothetical protein
MKTSRPLCGSLMILILLACLTPNLSAEEPTPKIIDKTNWEKAEGLVPDCLLEWVKKGEMILPLGELNYDTAEYFTPHTIESFTANVGKYDLNEEDIIVEAETGELAKMIIRVSLPQNRSGRPEGGDQDYVQQAIRNVRHRL